MAKILLSGCNAINEGIDLAVRKYQVLIKIIWIAVLQGLSGLFLALITEFPELGCLLIGKSFVVVTLRVITEKPIK